jgi:hypothetical protein
MRMGQVNIAATFAADGRPRPTTIFDFASPPSMAPEGLQYVRASGLAQARLQLAILTGNRRRALREIDRLVEIDRQLARMAGRASSDESGMSGVELEAHLARQQSAIASEKLALLAGAEFPRTQGLPDRPEPEFDDKPELLVEDTTISRKLAFAGFWLAALILIGTALTIAIPALAAAL